MNAVRRLLPWVLLFAGVFWLSRIVKPTGVFKVGDHLPVFSAQLVDGQRFTLPEKPGHVLVINFWATYCGPCRAEAPMLVDAQKHGAQVVGLVTERLAPDVARKAAQELGMSYTIGLSDEHLLQRFQVHTIPTTYVLAPDGAIVLSRVGKLDATELDEALARAGLGAGRATKI